jgi:hypothetical protein
MTAPSGPFYSPGLNLDTPIYRIHPQRYLKELLLGKLWLPATRLWDDPYENLISLCVYEFIGGDKKIKQASLGDARLPTFGQCWTTIPESDAMWRIYSEVDKKPGLSSFFSANEAVRLRTTPRKLVNAVAKGMGAGEADNCYIGSVKYMEEAELRSYIANAIGTYRDKAFAGVSGHADGLLLKRTPFAHEHEIRLLYVDSARKHERQDHIEIPINVNAVIEQITLDPRARTGGGEVKRRKWLEENGFKNEIDASLLYLGLLMVVPLYKPEDLK